MASKFRKNVGFDAMYFLHVHLRRKISVLVHKGWQRKRQKRLFSLPFSIFIQRSRSCEHGEWRAEVCGHACLWDEYKNIRQGDPAGCFFINHCRRWHCPSSWITNVAIDRRVNFPRTTRGNNDVSYLKNDRNSRGADVCFFPCLFHLYSSSKLTVSISE